MKRADCVAMTDARKTKIAMIGFHRLKGISNVSIAPADWKCEITTRFVSLMSYIFCITYMNKKNTLRPVEIESVSHGSKV